MMQIPQRCVFGISDHIQRACYFRSRAEIVLSNDKFSWNVNAAVYSSRALYEIPYSFYQAYAPDQLEVFSSKISGSVAYFKVIESLRIQDFHRNALRYPIGGQAFYGPAKLRTSTQRGSLAGLWSDETGAVHESKLRNASVAYNRPVIICGRNVQCDDIGTFLSLTEVISAYLESFEIESVKFDSRFSESFSLARRP